MENLISKLRSVCQVDIAKNYEHKHQELYPEDATKGLHKMCVDICKSLFRTLASEGIVFSSGFFKTLVATHTRTAQDMLKRYEDDAAINGIVFDRHEESLAVETFTNGIKKATEDNNRISTRCAFNLKQGQGDIGNTGHPCEHKGGSGGGQ